MADEEIKEEDGAEVEETEDEEVEGSGDNDEHGWDRMGGLVRSIVREELSSWSGPKSSKQTSSNSPRRPVAKKPERKKGFLSEGFFKGLGE